MDASLGRCLAILAVLGGGGCGARERAGDETEAGPCPIVHDFDWDAAIDARLGSPPILEVSGWIELDRPGYKPRLVAGPRDRAQPPTQYLRIAIEPKVPGDPTGPRYFLRTSLPAEIEYRAVVITCGGTEIERLTGIERRVLTGEP